MAPRLGISLSMDAIAASRAGTVGGDSAAHNCGCTHCPGFGTDPVTDKCRFFWSNCEPACCMAKHALANPAHKVVTCITGNRCKLGQDPILRACCCHWPLPDRPTAAGGDGGRNPKLQGYFALGSKNMSSTNLLWKKTCSAFLQRFAFICCHVH